MRHRPHRTHPEIVRRLRRAEGQLRTIARMVETGKPCAAVAMQLQAAERAIQQAKKTFIHDHIDHCLERSGSRASTDVIDEFKEISKYL